METQNTKLKIYHKAIAKRYMPFLPISFHCSGPWRPLIIKPAWFGICYVHSLFTHPYFLTFLEIYGFMSLSFRSLIQILTICWRLSISRSSISAFSKTYPWLACPIFKKPIKGINDTQAAKALQSINAKAQKLKFQKVQNGFFLYVVCVWN